MGWLAIGMSFVFGVPLSLLMTSKRETISDFLIGSNGGFITWLLMKSILGEVFTNLIIPLYLQYIIPTAASLVLGYLCL